MINDSLQTIALNERERGIIDEIYALDPVVKTCVSIIFDRIFVSGISFKQRDGKTLDPNFERYLSKFWLEFAKQSTEEIIKYGYVGFRIITGVVGEDKSKGKYPIVVPRSVYDVNIITTSDGIRKLVTRPRGNFEVYLYVHTFPHDFNGNHNSRLSTLVSSYSFIKTIEEYTLTAEYVRSHPSMIVQHMRDPDGKSMKMITGVYAEDVMLGNQEYAAERRANASASEVARMKMVSNGVNQDGNADFVVDPQNKRVTNLRQIHDDNLFLLPPNLELSRNTTLPASRADLVQQFHLHALKVCSVFGLPKPMVFNESSSRTSNSEMDMQLLDRSIVEYEKFVVSLLSEVYEFIFKEDEIIFSLSNRSEVTIEQLTKAWEYDVIDDNTFTSMMAKILGIDEELVKKNPDVIKKQITLHGKVNGSNNGGTTSSKQVVE